MKIKIKRDNGSLFKAESYVQFNDGYSHIIIDGGCYIIINDNKPSAWIFEEALRELKKLPTNPYDLLKKN